MEVLEESSDELWFLIPAGRPHVHDDGWVHYVGPLPVLGWASPRERLIATTSYFSAKVDLTRRVVVSRELIEFEDVELDVVWRWGEPAEVVDVEEFEALGLPGPEMAGYRRQADQIRRAVDAGEGRWGQLRERLVETTPISDRRLASAWMAGVGPHLCAEVTALLQYGGPSWIERQAAGEGWLLAAGSDSVAAVVWLGREEVLEVTHLETEMGVVMNDLLLTCAPTLLGYACPPLS